MTRTTRALRPIVVVAAAVVFAGCSSSTIDVPEGAQVTIAPAVTASAAPSDSGEAPTDSGEAPADSGEAPAEGIPEESAEPVEDELDCAALLPVETVEAGLELPAGFVTASDSGVGCAWSMAGNPSALTLQSVSGATAETFSAQQEQGVVESSELGDQAFFRAADPAFDPAASVVVLLADRLVTLRSYVGDREQLEALAVDALAALGLDPA